MEKWPAWSAPLLGGCGGGLGGLAIVGDARFPFPPLYAAFGGFALGVFAGLIVWYRDNRRPDADAPLPIVARWMLSHSSSRWVGAIFMIAGAACLLVNHTLVATTGKKLFPLVLGGSFFLALGLAGVLLPQILTAGATRERVPWWGHMLGGILAIGGVALGMYLWLAVY